MRTPVSAATVRPSAPEARFLATQVGMADNTDKRDGSMAEARARSADALAPWAEIVPHTGLMTEEALLALPEDGWRYELVEGRLVRMPPSGLRATQIAFITGAALFRVCAAPQTRSRDGGGRWLQTRSGHRPGAGRGLHPRRPPATT